MSLPGLVAGVTGERLPPGAVEVRCGPVTVAHWGLDPLPGDGRSFVLSKVVRERSGRVTPEDLAARLREVPDSLADLLPPFAALDGDDDGVLLVADSMGFRQTYFARNSLSTSALLLQRSGIDETGLAVQSLLGWQIGHRTLGQGVSKLPAGASARLGAEGVSINAPHAASEPALTLREAVKLAAGVVRSSLESLLDESPDAVLQLTGGLDSRLLLSAIPEARRRGLRAMTLGVEGSGDVEVATRIAERYGLSHHVHPMPALDDLAPEEAWGRVLRAAVDLDALSDPVAHAALSIAEERIDQGVRISGLGGEVARGFYYVGRVHDRSYTFQDARRLAAWRMFANEAVEQGMLEPDFAAWAREVAEQEVYEALRGGGDEWFRATDHLYLRHRMQRWAGITDTAAGGSRTVVNPMLDREFLAIAARLAPGAKAGARFLAAVQMELDPELGRLPLEGRAAPAAYADPSPWHTVGQAVASARRAAGKAAQRFRHSNRAPAGGAALAGRVVEHWRTDPNVLTPAARSSRVQQQWFDDVILGKIRPQVSSVALVANLVTVGQSENHKTG